MDAETQKEVLKQEELYNLVNHDGWKHVRARFNDEILKLQNVNSVTGRNATEKIRCLEVNKKVSEALFDILVDIEGTAATFNQNKELKEKSYIHREG